MFERSLVSADIEPILLKKKASFPELQKHLLELAANVLASDGRLVYWAPWPARSSGENEPALPSHPKVEVHRKWLPGRGLLAPISRSGCLSRMNSSGIYAPMGQEIVYIPESIYGKL
mmetsp:Transcript_28862/g.70375  ORF Transcript_28862/g.70375 Transcript_28862/m.70375 type:complete len:117 (-) Transcript_28862:234-584(-)